MEGLHIGDPLVDRLRVLRRRLDAAHLFGCGVLFGFVCVCMFVSLVGWCGWSVV